MRTLKLPGALAAVMAAGCLLAGHSAPAQEREWIVAPYLWGAGTSLDVRVRNDPVYAGNLEFSDLVDKLDFALQVHVETRKNRFGLLFDITYLETSDSFLSPPNPPLPGGTALATSAELAIFEAGGFYRRAGDSDGWDLVLGIRVMDTGADIALTPPEPLSARQLDGSKSLTDGFAGLRYVGALGENWLVKYAGMSEQAIPTAAGT